VSPDLIADDNLGTVDLVIPAKAEWVAVARLAVAAVASRLRFSVDEIEDVKLAIAEACTNCITHAARAARIEVTCEAESEQLRVTVGMRGAGPRLEVIGNSEDEDRQADELGIFLIRALMDTVETHADSSDGRYLVMTKRVVA
jgi:serine/threonine-protein kinase RsbW